MDNSDEELFEAIPSTSTSNTSSEWIVERNTSVQNTFKIEKEASSDVLPKHISIKLTRLAKAKIKRKRDIMQFRNKNRRYRILKWKNGNCGKKKKKNQKSQVQEEFEKIVHIPEPTLESLENVNNDIHLHEEIFNAGEQSYTCASENMQIMQNDNRSFTLSTSEMENEEENLYDNKTNKYADISSYKFHQRRKQVFNIVDKVMHSDISSLLNNEAVEQDVKSERNQSPTKRQETKIAKNSQFLDIEDNSLRKRLKLKRKISTYNNTLLKKDRKDQIISSSSSNNNKLAIENNMETNANDNLIKLHLFDEDRNRKVLQPNVRFSRELRVNLTKLEEINDVDVIKWRKSREQNTLKGSIPVMETKQSDKQNTIIYSNKKVPTYRKKSSRVKKDFKDHLATKRRSFINSLHQNQLILKEIESNELFFSESSKGQTTNARENSSELLVASSTKHAKKLLPSNKFHNLLDRKLQKKYKLFKKPKVLLIKLEYLKHSIKNDKYSAVEINHLTKKYISNVMKSSLFAVQAENVNFSASSEQNINRSCEQSNTEENLKGTFKNA